MDSDRRKVTWNNLYKKIYTDENWEFWKLINFDKIDDSGAAGFHKNISVEQDISDTKIQSFYHNWYDTFKISGDTDCDTKDIGINNELKSGWHKFPNFSLMPCKGGMNSKKGLDDLGKFLNSIKKFYDCCDGDRENYVKENLSQNKNWPVLLDYLNLFNCFDDYCTKIYLISGYEMRNIWEKDKPYEEKVLEYWEKRKKIFGEKGVTQYWLEENIDQDKYNK